MKIKLSLLILATVLLSSCNALIMRPILSTENSKFCSLAKKLFQNNKKIQLNATNCRLISS